MTNETNLDLDPIETREWLDALQAVLFNDGPERAAFLLQQLLNKANAEGVKLTSSINTPYRNTIKPHEEKQMPPDEGIGKRINALIRWNAVAMVLRAGKYAPELGGHIASYASASTLYETGFNYFFKGPKGENGGDLLYIQGHSAPGIYARAFLEGRLTEKQLEKFRQEVEVDGLSSYPHPWLMNDFWQFPTVSMGLGPLQAIYQARFLKYLENRGLIKAEGRKVWAFLGDGEMDEPESVGALSIAAREKLDNLIFVVNCNLQRLDGPVRGNGKIIQELEGLFRGAGWNVIKVIWGGRWDPLFARDNQGWLQKRMEECLDGDYQSYKANDGSYVRQHFFNQYPELKKMVENMTDEEIWRLNRGGHDPQKVYAAYARAVEHKGTPTVILAKTIKGYGMGAAGEGQNITHQQKKMTIDQLKAFRDRFNIPVSDDKIADIPFYKPDDDSPEIKYLKKQREALGGYLPHRSIEVEQLKIPHLEEFSSITKGLGDREISTTMAFVRILSVLLKNKDISSRIVPIVPDECRTFGMEGLFRQIGIYSPVGQLYTPVDHEQVMYYREAVDGQILEEGINEAGAFCSWIAAATSYSSNKLAMIPFYIYYSMFGFQRIGDLAWAAGDMQARGFLLGGTAGRTTLAGEGLQHQDGHSHVLASTIPNCISYDPTYAYELAVIVQNGLYRMYEKQDNVFYYITIMNENYSHPDMPEGVEEGIIKGMYLLKENKKKSKNHVQLMGCGTILREVIKAAEMLEEDFSITSDIWSVTSFNELRKEGLAVERYNNMHPKNKPQQSYVTSQLKERPGPVIATTDYMRIYADQIRPFVPNRYITLGTDGYGRSDTRTQLRHFFEVDAKFIVLTALNALVAEGTLDKTKVVDAMKRYNINPDKLNPMTH
ncbi:pyruvate dehydrogenase (acetyl-transferring), homodimeric type [Legionella pneumophila]|uniref:Pyruvate dehydrogenase E1 component n=1 Tax=Legionella pneumophila subsp. pascullei TaxID=91890 RepID=A0AAX2IWV8_LEGPN|nr:pyruvate dehydrogenase (acetyl-transferring), homodimeric type [Legionella pneumophila]AMP92491.1 pyruvate dehydrogenase [Legionella pneumophila subsp. pascullei]AMP95457.1 pyruvate dehydrogenase [Legionella pneumophila subsp. pascullei]SQG90360.1 pyruvate dehydrogenase E1 component oxidoreductase protein AceE [Legionella pneumophila subsp. pascullei]VEH06553.1 pyruvate dehydrogenase E1 component oxidoreductase protein AceE [Legionella pneumophila subsp. pascullei]HDU8259375.1 pyruvate dehy